MRASRSRVCERGHQRLTARDGDSFGPGPGEPVAGGPQLPLVGAAAVGVALLEEPVGGLPADEPAGPAGFVGVEGGWPADEDLEGPPASRGQGGLAHAGTVRVLSSQPSTIGVRPGSHGGTSIPRPAPNRFRRISLGTRGNPSGANGAVGTQSRTAASL